MKEGVYKIRNSKGVSYIRIYSKGNKRYIQQDHSIPTQIRGNANDFFVDYDIVRVITNPVHASKVKVDVTFFDQDGDQIVLRARNIQALENIFKMFPGVANAFGIVMNR